MIPASFTIKDKAKQNPKVLLAILAALHLIAISLNRVPGQPELRYLHTVALTVAYPVQWVASHSVSGVKGVVNRYIYLRDRTAENESLRSKNAELEARVAELGEKAKFLDQSNAINRSPLLSEYPRVVASVIGRDSNPMAVNTIVIDRGTLSGVARNQPVVTPEGGLVGRVIQTAPGSSRVLLLTDERHGAGALIAQTAGGRTLGVLKGKNEAYCWLNFSEPPETLANGEAVITSGQDRLYPKGLLVGHVVNLSGSGSIPSRIEVAPAAQLTRLETVAVLQISSDEIYRRYDELIALEQQEKEKQEKSSDRKKREAGR